nr:response regulator transcription factor [Planosporangium thailandense]
MRAPRSAADSLTPREREVLVLIAEGGTNRQIAKHLGVAERTARTHVSNILGKLGLASRTQAAMWAVKEGLVAGREPA